MPTIEINGHAYSEAYAQLRHWAGQSQGLGRKRPHRRRHLNHDSELRIGRTRRPDLERGGITMTELQRSSELTYAQNLALERYKALDNLIDAFDEAGLLEGMPDAYKGIILRLRAEARDAFVDRI